MKTQKIFYGWWIVLGGFFIMATCYTVFINCTSLFLVPVTKDLNITRSQYTLCTSISSIVGIFSSAVIGKLLDKHSARVLGTIGVGLIVLVMAGWAFVTQLWQIYALSFLAGFFVLAGTRLMISVLITNWFTEKRGLAVSLALMGSGAGGVILTQVINGVMQATNWRITYLVLALITLVFSMPLTAITFHNKPSDIGLKPYGSELNGLSEKSARPPKDKPVLVQVGWSVLKKSSAFWMLIAGFLLMGMANGGVLVNMSAQLTDAGHTASFAAMIISVYLFVVIIGKISLGIIYDRLGMVAGSIFGSIATILGTTSMLFSSSVVGPFIFAVSFGFGTCLGTVAPPIMAVTEFGKKDIGYVTGIITAFELVGVAIAAPMMGMFYDTYHTYAPGWVILSIMGAAMLVMLLLSVGMAKKLVTRVEAGQKTISPSSAEE